MRDDVYSFTSTFMNEAVFRGASEMSTWAYDRNVGIFSKKMLLISYSFHKHRLLFVVINASTQLNGLGVNSLSEEHLVLIHFDSLQTESEHETWLVALKLSAWLNSVWQVRAERTVDKIENYFPLSGSRSMEIIILQGKNYF